MWGQLSARTHLAIVLVCSSLASVALFGFGAIRNHETEFAYLIWNLFLAWLPLLIGLWLIRLLRHSLWSSWLALFVTVLWVGFLPNSFYMISDFIHVQEVQRVDLLYDVVMFSSFIFNGVILGVISLYMIHQELIHRLKRTTSAVIVTGILALCSFAIFLGRDLRWNTWDILVNPAGILVDVSDIVLHPASYPHTLGTTASFFVLLASLYLVAWYMVQAVTRPKHF